MEMVEGENAFPISRPPLSDGLKAAVRGGCLGGVIAHARANPEVEAGAFLLGSFDGERWVVEGFVEARNDISSAGAIVINPYQAYQAVREAEGRGLKVVGWAHSHLGFGARPSLFDIGRMLPYTRLLWVIVDTPTGEARAFSAPDGGVVEVPIGNGGGEGGG